jgi:hypothetical protein
MGEHPVEGDRSIPVEVLEGILLLEACAIEAIAEVLTLAPVDLVLRASSRKSR